MKKNMSKTIPFIMYALLLFIVCIALSTGSCAFTSEGLAMISGDYVSPTLETFTLKDEKTAIINFSHEVTFPVLEYYLLGEFNTRDFANEGVHETGEAVYVGKVGLIEQDTIVDGDTDNIASVPYILTFPIKTEAHLTYILSGIVKDNIGNTLKFTIGFAGYNSRIPKIIFSEISTEYSKPRTEFVEFYVLEDGNLAGMILHSANDGIEKDIVFPSVEVKKGEYVVLHMRTVEEGAVSELGEDLSLSNTKQSTPEGRDIWIQGTETRLSRNDVLLLRDRLNGSLVDAVAYVDGAKTEWTKDSMLSYISEAVEANIWNGGTDISGAINVEKITGTRTLNRQNINEIIALFEMGETELQNTKENWLIVDTSNLSPGNENSSIPYE